MRYQGGGGRTLQPSCFLQEPSLFTLDFSVKTHLIKKCVGIKFIRHKFFSQEKYMRNSNNLFYSQKRSKYVKKVKFDANRSLFHIFAPHASRKANDMLSIM